MWVGLVAPRSTEIPRRLPFPLYIYIYMPTSTHGVPAPLPVLPPTLQVCLPSRPSADLIFPFACVRANAYIIHTYVHTCRMVFLCQQQGPHQFYLCATFSKILILPACLRPPELEQDDDLVPATEAANDRLRPLSCNSVLAVVTTALQCVKRELPPLGSSPMGTYLRVYVCVVLFSFLVLPKPFRSLPCDFQPAE